MKEYNITIPEMERLIDLWIYHERNRAIIKRKIIDGVSYECVAEEFDMSVRGVKNIVYKCQEILFKHM